ANKAAAMHRLVLILAAFALPGLPPAGAAPQASPPAAPSARPAPDSVEEVYFLLRALSSNPAESQASLDYLEERWRPSFAPMAVELMRFARDPSASRR